MANPIYRQTLAEAWRMTRRHKFLWFFGFFAILLNSGVVDSFSATAIPAMVCSCGPPCKPGKIALSISSLMDLPSFCVARLVKIIAPRGPRKSLCVVVVTTSIYGKGDG